MSQGIKILAAIILLLCIVSVAREASAKKHIEVSSVKDSQIKAKDDDICDASSSNNLVTNTEIIDLMSPQHTALVRIQGYAMKLIKCSNKTEVIDNTPFNFTSMMSLPTNYSTDKIVKLSGESSSLTFLLTTDLLKYDPESASFSRERKLLVSTTPSPHSEYVHRDRSVYSETSDSSASMSKAVTVYYFRSIAYQDTDGDIDCVVTLPSLVGFKDGEYYTCSARRMLTCSQTDDSDVIVSLVFDELHFEVDGSHDTIFTGSFSKKPRNCLPKLESSSERQNSDGWRTTGQNSDVWRTTGSVGLLATRQTKPKSYSYRARVSQA